MSIGYCFRIAGITEKDFIKYLGKNHISIFHYDNAEESAEEFTSDQIATRSFEKDGVSYNACYHGTFITPGGSVNVGRPVESSYGARPVIQVNVQAE